MTASFDRTTVARPPDANFGPVRARRPDTVAEMRRLRWGGASMDAIAEQFGVSKRTAYRYVDAGVKYFEVEIEGWCATFARSPRRPPWRVSPWARRKP